MENVLLVCLVSDQTIPNIQLIKEFESKVTSYLFITTKGMEQKGVRLWIENTCNIKENIDLIEVNQFSFTDIEYKLKVFDFESYEKIMVNLTGGTKVMTLVASDFFKNLAAEMYYVTGNNNEYIKVHPIKKHNTFPFNSKITISEYLTAYGFTYKPSSLSDITLEQTKAIFDAFCKIDLNIYTEALKFINSKRKKRIEEVDFNKIKDFLSAINYIPEKENCLSKKETQYLSGDWFEEYIGLSIKNELGLRDDELFIGATITNQKPTEGINSITTLLGEETKLSDNDFNNEMDVMFVHNNTFYSIECKTSIIAYKTIKKEDSVIDKPYSILGETIYKSDSLKSRFGLYPKTSIVTLSDFTEYKHEQDKGKRNNKKIEMEELINRANISRIKLIDKSMLSTSDTIFKLIRQ